MDSIWNHITDQRLVARILLDNISSMDLFLEEGEKPKKPHIKVHVFAIAILAITGGVLIGLRIGGVNGIITTASLSLGLIISIALIYVKRKNHAIDHVIKKFRGGEILILLDDSNSQVIADNLDLEAVRILVNKNNFVNEEGLDAILRTKNSQIAGRHYDGTNWDGSKGQTICREIFGVNSQVKPENILTRFTDFKRLPNIHDTEINLYFRAYPNDTQTIVDRLRLDQLVRYIGTILWKIEWQQPLPEQDRRILKAIFYTTNPNIEGDSFMSPEQVPGTIDLRMKLTKIIQKLIEPENKFDTRVYAYFMLKLRKAVLGSTSPIMITD